MPSPALPGPPTGRYRLASTIHPCVADDPWSAGLVRDREVCRSASGSRSPVERERPGGGGDRDAPADSLQLLLEAGWLVGDLHEPVGGAIVQLPADDRGRWSFD